MSEWTVWVQSGLIGFLLGLLVEAIRHHRTILRLTDQTDQMFVVIWSLDESIDFAKEEGHWDELERRIDTRLEDMAAALPERQEGRLEHAIRRWLMM